MTVLIMHATESARQGFAAALPGQDVRAVRLEGGPGAYDEYARRRPKIRDLVPVPDVLVAFSAGTWALRRWLRDPENRAQARAVVILDGLYGAPGGVCDLRPYDGVIAYGREAIASGGQKRLVMTYSRAHPDTRICSEAIASTTGLGAGVSVRGYDSTDHGAQLTTVGPDVVRDAIASQPSRASSSPVALFGLLAVGAYALWRIFGRTTT